MAACTKCGAYVDREPIQTEIEGGYQYCDPCEDAYQADLANDPVFAQFYKDTTCSFCGRQLTDAELSFGMVGVCGAHYDMYPDDFDSYEDAV